MRMALINDIMNDINICDIMNDINMYDIMNDINMYDIMNDINMYDIMNDINDLIWIFLNIMTCCEWQKYNGFVTTKQFTC